MSKIDRFDQRLSAVESTVVDGDLDLDALSEVTDLRDDLDRLDQRLDELERRVADIEGTTQSISGYVGNVNSVNEATEKQADAAVAAVDRLEKKIENFERQVSVAAFNDLAERVEQLEREQERLNEESPLDAGGNNDFVFGVPDDDQQQIQNGEREADQGRRELTARGSPIDTSGEDHASHENSSGPRQLPTGQETVEETYAQEQNEEAEDDDDDSMRNIIDKNMPKWLRK